MLAGSAGPVALFALGAALAIQRFDRRTVLAAFAVTAAKLTAYPAVVWCVLSRLPQIEPGWVQTGVLLAALPSAGNIHAVAQHYEADASSVSAAIALSTLFSVVTIPLAIWLVVR
jgi:malonate transporter and related proteins